MTRPVLSFAPAGHPAWLAIAGTLLLIHLTWYVAVWPGPMGQDGFSVLHHVGAGTPALTHKDPAWLLYAMATYGTTGRVEALMLPLLLLNVLMLTRMLHWGWQTGHRNSTLLLLGFIACAPHVLHFETSLYPDATFNLAFIAVLFEVWLCLRRQRLGWDSLLMLALLFPCAAFFKGNGVLIWLPLLYLALRLPRKAGVVLLALLLCWTTLITLGSKTHQLGKGHGVLMPLVLFETVNFMQSRPMPLQETRHMVTNTTRDIVHRYASQQDLDALYDRDYWDTLWHQNSDRIRFQQMTAADQHRLLHEFLTYNLWRNLPAFVSSRVNVFLASALAQGGMIATDNARHGVPAIRTHSTYNPLGLTHLPQWVAAIFQASYDWRFVLWTPFVGLALLIGCTRHAWQRRHTGELLITGVLVLELLAIGLFSIAAEYRYLLMFFYSPLLLWPMLNQQRQIRSGAV